MSGVVGQAPIAHFAIAPEGLDDTKGVFSPGSDAATLSVKRVVGTGSLSTTGGLALDPPFNALGLGFLLALGIRLCFVAIEDLFGPMQTVGHAHHELRLRSPSRYVPARVGWP